MGVVQEPEVGAVRLDALSAVFAGKRPKAQRDSAVGIRFIAALAVTGRHRMAIEGDVAFDAMVAQIGGLEVGGVAGNYQECAHCQSQEQPGRLLPPRAEALPEAVSQRLAQIARGEVATLAGCVTGLGADGLLIVPAHFFSRLMGGINGANEYRSYKIVSAAEGQSTDIRSRFEAKKQAKQQTFNGGGYEGGPELRGYHQATRGPCSEPVTSCRTPNGLLGGLIVERLRSRPLAAEVAGWAGTLMIMAAYVGVSFKVLSPTGLLYQLLNLAGAIGIMIIALVKHVRQSVVLNIFWAAIALVAIFTLAFKH